MAICLALVGCSSPGSMTGHWTGPSAPASVEIDDAPPPATKVKYIHTPHYTIECTIQDRPDMLYRLGQLMEGGYAAYHDLAPGVPPTQRPMECFVFANRLQWVDFTRKNTGSDAETYLKIGRGGYTLRGRDWYVSYNIGEIGTYSIAAHEGWHQFCARHFKGSLPPFLEEGLACMFEDVQWDGDLPRWNLSMNPTRALSLRRVMDANQAFPLSQLITLHAGSVIGYADIKIEAFYSQNWAFARFLWEGENGKYRPALQRLLADTAAGTVADPTGSLRRSYLGWNPAGVRPMLEHYLGEDFPTIEQEYNVFMRHVAYDEMSQQFELP
jgi:hypothetical protein